MHAVTPAPVRSSEGWMNQIVVQRVALEGNFTGPQKNGSIAEHHGRKVAGSEDKRDAHGDADDDPNGMEVGGFLGDERRRRLTVAQPQPVDQRMVRPRSSLSSTQRVNDFIQRVNKATNVFLVVVKVSRSSKRTLWMTSVGKP